MWDTYHGKGEGVRELPDYLFDKKCAVERKIPRNSKFVRLFKPEAAVIAYIRLHNRFSDMTSGYFRVVGIMQYNTPV